MIFLKLKINLTKKTMNKVVEIAEGEIGYSEYPANTNQTKYGEWFGLNGVPWCGIFVSWCYAMAGKPLPNIGFTKGFAGCQYALAYFQKAGKVVKDGQPGDIVFFDFTGDGRTDHVGIVRMATSKLGYQTIEGNTGKGISNNGGTVRKQYRKMKYMIFVRP